MKADLKGSARNLGKCVCFFLLWGLCPPVFATPYSIEISKTHRLLIVKREQETVKEFRIAHGKGGEGAKRQRGDNKTPTGIYAVVDFKADSQFHFFMQLNYPNLIDAWYGYQNEIINATEFKQIASAYKNKTLPPQTTALGGYIGLHGIGQMNEKKRLIHEAENWTEGCIALKNEEMNDLRQYITIGTKVLIRE